MYFYFNKCSGFLFGHRWAQRFFVEFQLGFLWHYFISYDSVFCFVFLWWCFFGGAGSLWEVFLLFCIVILWKTAHSWHMIEFEIMRTRKFCLFTAHSSNIHLRICIMTHSDAVEALSAFSFFKSLWVVHWNTASLEKEANKYICMVSRFWFCT